MTVTLTAILGLIVLGMPITLAIDRRARGPLLLGASFLYGSGTIFLVLFALSTMHVRWTLITVTVSALAVFCATSFLARRQTAAERHPGTSVHFFDLITLVALTGYALDATLSALGLWDFWAIWGLKANVFLEKGGIDWHFLESRWNVLFHLDYPILVPLNFDFVALVGGGWSDRWLGLMFVAWAAAILLIVRALAARETSPFFASLLTLALATVVASPWLGYAEGPLIAFGGAGILFVRAALRDGDAVSWRHGALMLGFAANCKNEGLAMLVAVTIGVAVVGPLDLAGANVGESARRVWRRGIAILRNLWPAYALTAPWLLLRLMHALPTDIAGGSPFSRLVARLPHTGEILFFLASHLAQPWFWLAVLAGFLIAPAAARKGERFVLLVTAIQVAFYVLAYFATPRGLRWHMMTSWSRLTAQVALPITFVVFLMLANLLRGSQDAPHAEARSDE
jgi:hypothetical protein